MPKLYLMLAALFLITPLNIQASCRIHGTITAMDIGTFSEQTPNGNGGTRNVSITYTQVSVDIKNATGNHDCIKKSINHVRSYGLCEDINVYKGDVIDATAETWVYDGQCLSDITIERN